MARTDERLLFIIDSAEDIAQLPDTTVLAALRTVLQSTSACLLIVTRDLNQTIPARRTALGDSLSSDECFALMQQFCPSLARRLADKVHQHLAGHPLAITWAAAQAANATTDIESLINDLESEEFPLLGDPGSIDGNLAIVFDRTWKTLSDDARSLLRMLSMLPRSPVPRGICIAIIENDEERANEAIQMLFRHAMLRKADSDSSDLQFSHDLTFAYARTASPLRVDTLILRRLIKWAIAFAKKSERELLTKNVSGAQGHLIRILEFQTEIDAVAPPNFIDWLHSLAHSLYWDYAQALANHTLNYEAFTLLMAVVKWWEACYSKLNTSRNIEDEDYNLSPEAGKRSSAGCIQGRLLSAVILCGQEETRLPIHKEICKALGDLNSRRGSDGLDRDQPNSIRVCAELAHENLAKVLLKQGELIQARRTLTDSIKFRIEIWKTLSEDSMWRDTLEHYTAFKLHDLADFADGCNRLAEAEVLFEEALSLLMKAGSDSEVSTTHCKLSIVTKKLGKWEKAMRHDEADRDILRRVVKSSPDDKVAISDLADANLQLGDSFGRLGELNSALECFTAAVEGFSKGQERRLGYVDALKALGMCRYQLKQFEAAESALRDAEKRLHMLEHTNRNRGLDLGTRWQTLYYLAASRKAQGKSEGNEELLARASDAFNEYNEYSDRFASLRGQKVVLGFADAQTDQS